MSTEPAGMFCFSETLDMTMVLEERKFRWTKVEDCKGVVLISIAIKSVLGVRIGGAEIQRFPTGRGVEGPLGL